MKKNPALINTINSIREAHPEVAEKDIKVIFRKNGGYCYYPLIEDGKPVMGKMTFTHEAIAAKRAEKMEARAKAKEVREAAKAQAKEVAAAARAQAKEARITAKAQAKAVAAAARAQKALEKAQAKVQATAAAIVSSDTVMTADGSTVTVIGANAV